MNLKELLDTYDDQSIISQLSILFNDENIDGYKQTLKDLRRTVPSKSTMRLRLQLIPAEHFDDHPDWDTEPYIAVDGIDKTNQVWGLDFMNWSKWLASDIEAETLVNYGGLFILAHCLWEMTFHGFTQKEITKISKELSNRVKSIKKK
jgi:hypothetical protein